MDPPGHYEPTPAEQRQKMVPDAMAVWEAEECLVVVALEYLDTPTLVQNKMVCKRWQIMCTTAINLKLCGPNGNRESVGFRYNRELRTAVLRYWHYKRSDAEKFSRTRGWPIGVWDVSRVTDFSKTFQPNRHGKPTYKFCPDLSSWDVSNATTMSHMFRSCIYFNGDLSRWDTGNVKNFDYMFQHALALKRDGHLCSWNTSSAVSMQGMFCDCANFQEDISGWDTSNVTNMAVMFNGAVSFNCSLNSWNTSRVVTMKGMFLEAHNFNGNIVDWDTRAVRDMSMMFYGTDEFNRDITTWNVRSLVDMTDMVTLARGFEYVDNLNGRFGAKMMARDEQPSADLGGVRNVIEDYLVQLDTYDVVYLDDLGGRYFDTDDNDDSNRDTVENEGQHGYWGTTSEDVDKDDSYEDSSFSGGSDGSDDQNEGPNEPDGTYGGALNHPGIIVLELP